MTPLDGIAILGATLAAGFALGTMTRRDVGSRVAAALAGAIAVAAAGAAMGVGIAIAAALVCAAAALSASSSRAAAAGPAIAAAAWPFSPVAAMAGLALCAWRNERNVRAACAALVVAAIALPDDLAGGTSRGTRAFALLLAGGMGLASSRVVAARGVTPTARRVVVAVAVAMPALALLALLAVDGRATPSAGGPIAGVLAAAAALLAGLLMGGTLLGLLVIVSTRSSSGPLVIGSVVTAAILVPLLGTEATIPLVPVLALSWGVFTRVVAPRIVFSRIDRGTPDPRLI